MAWKSFAIAMAAMVLATGARAKSETSTVPSAEAATVYIYRPSAGGLMLRGASFDIDGVPVVKLSNRSYTKLTVPPGLHVLGQQWPVDVSLGMNKLRENVEWLAGETYYYRFDILASIGVGTIAFGWRLTEVDESVAKVGIFDHKHVPAKNLDKLRVGDRPSPINEPTSPPPAEP